MAAIIEFGVEDPQMQTGVGRNGVLIRYFPDSHHFIVVGFVFDGVFLRRWALASADDSALKS